MKRLVTLLCAALLLALLTVSSLAQSAPRAPVIVAASTLNNAASAFGFSPNVEIYVTGVEVATVEGSEPQHSCAAGAHSKSIWLRTFLPAGTLNLDTSGSSYTTGIGSSPDTVISIYRLTNWTFQTFADLSAIGCNNNGTSAGIINGFSIVDPDDYMVQISAAPGFTVTGSSQVVLKATFAPAVPHPNDDPDNARNLKFPGLPAVVSVYNATLSLDEPSDPALANPISNSVWFKFTFSTRRIFAVSNFYSTSEDLWFSLFQKSGPNYLPVPGASSNYSNSLTAILEPGTYYLRVAVYDRPEGTSAGFITFATIAYLTPTNYEFSVGTTEGTAGATPSITGWKAKNATPGPAGDGAFCDGAPPYECYLRLVGSGPGESTSFKGKLNLQSVNLKKGDILTIQGFQLDLVGTPNYTAKFTLTDAAGATQSYTLSVNSTADYQTLITPVVASFTPVKAVLKIKNKDTVPGNSVEIDSIVAAVLRVGEGRNSGAAPLKLPLGGEIPAAWASAAAAAPHGLLAAPPPAQ